MPGPGGKGPVGPFPPHVADTDDARDAYDRMRRRLLWTMPSGLYVLGSRSGAARNMMTLNWATQVSVDPKLVAVGVERVAVTHRYVSESRTFTLNTIDRDDRTIVRRFTKPAPVDLDAMTVNGVAFRDGLTGAPVLECAVAWLDCEVRELLDVGTHTLFVGEVVDCGFQRHEDTPVLRMEDTRMNYGG